MFVNYIYMNKKTIEFLKEYDTENLEFNKLKYRQGARISCSFGLSEGYKFINDKFYWGYVRIHSGVDRSGIFNIRSEQIDNVVYAPFNFERSEINDYGPTHVYGSLIRLFSDKHEFEMRIVHMNPKEIPASVLYKLQNGMPIERDTLIGKSGNYGKSDGEHTHTEFVSYQLNNEIFDEILYEKYSSAIELSYQIGELLEFYSNQPAFRNASKQKITEDFDAQKLKRNISDLINKYKYRYRDWFYGKTVSRYSSEHLFNGL